MYLEYFGFREKPFNVTPDPRFFYNNPIYQETYAGLVYGIRERKGFISLIGEVGTGKTTLLRKLMSELREPVHFVYLCYTTLTFEELLSFICADLGIALGEKSHLQRIQALNDFLLHVSRDGGTSVLLVDEAQNLADEVLENLRLLSNLETASEKLLQIVLVGQPELERKLAQPKLRQLKQRISIQGRLGRLKEREVGPFISSRLTAAGYEGEPLFTAEAIQRIATYSKGTPRLINVICDNALLVAYSLNQKTVQVEVIEEVARDLQLKQDIRPSRLGKLPGEDGVGGQFHNEEEDFGGSESSVAKTASRVVATSTEINPPKRAFSQEGTQPSRRFSRVLTGAVLALALLGGAGAAIFPELTSRGFSDVFMRIGEWLGKTHDPTLGSKEEREGIKPFSPALPADDRQTRIRRDEENVEENTPLLQPEKKAESKVENKAESTEKTKFSSREEQNLEPQIDSVQEPPSSSWKDHPLRIEAKMTVFDLVLKNYRGYNILAVDLIHENNPHLKNLEKIVVGDKIWLPPLTQETLVREQPDGSYRLILASFRSTREAERFAQGVRSQGYVVTVTPRKVTENIVVQRVEIQALKNVDEVKQAWGLVNIDNVFAGKSLPASNGIVGVKTATRPVSAGNR